MTQNTLAIDFGSRYIGIALVRNEDGTNTPLFACTLTHDQVQLKKKLNPRPLLRRMRRTRKTRKARLKKLAQGLRSAGLEEHLVSQLISFSRRRGWISLFGPSDVDGDQDKSDEENILFRFSREEFFQALEQKLSVSVPPDKYQDALNVCENILNRRGDPRKEIRQIRIDNRGVSRCAWDSCNKVTPRRDNALQDALAQFVYLIIDIEQIRQNSELHKKLNVNLENLANLGKRLRNNGTEGNKEERKALLNQRAAELNQIKLLSNESTWKTNRANIVNILENSGGRNRYCRHHSAEFVQYQLEGKPIPFKKTLTERDIISRREQVLFQRIWRYIEARILPLALGGIHRLVIERVAIDLLGGTFKQRIKIGDKRLEEMYQQGPMFGFKNDLDMLKTEFGGLCAYCGNPSESILEREHILPKKDFTFDGYLNKLPSCPDCNRQRKSSRSPKAALLTISESAYDAYKNYLKNKFKSAPPHHLHTIKKGILKLMTEQNRTWEAEQYLSLVAKNYLEVTGSQRSPRPLARYLGGRLKRKYGKVPKAIFSNGRHTALLRDVAYPDFSKAKEKAEGGLINHAVDAIILGSKLPSPSVLEGLNLPIKAMKSWAESVRKKASTPGENGIPALPTPPHTVSGFESLHPDNYIQADLAFFNWNRRDSRIQRQDIYGWNTYADTPTRRTAAAEIVGKLLEADKKSSAELRKNEVKKVVDNILHPHLKAVLEKAAEQDTPGKDCADELARWLRKSLRGSLKKTVFSKHPADLNREKLLRDFVERKADSIPATVGIKMLRRGSDKGAVDLSRVDKHTGKIQHLYRADPAVVAKIVGYKRNKHGVARKKPFVFDWRQSWAIVPKSSLVPPVPEGVLKGRSFGQPLPDEDVWFATLHEYFSTADIAEYAIVRQGNVAVYENGLQGYIRNFSSSQGFKVGQLKEILGVKRSPFSKNVVKNTII